jgi:hypothetical protein
MIMEKIVEILMKRDGMTYADAKDLVNETRNLLLTSDPWDADEIMADMLGLEPDYIMDLIG